MGNDLSSPSYRLIDHLIGPSIWLMALVAADRCGGKKKPYPTKITSEADRHRLIHEHIVGSGISPRRCTKADGSTWVEGRAYGLAAPCLWPSPDGLVGNRIILDCDGGDHVGGSDEVALLARDAAITLLERSGATPLVARSHGGHGWHVMVLFDRAHPGRLLSWLAMVVRDAVQAQVAKAKIDAFPGNSISIWPPVALPVAGGAPGRHLGGGCIMSEHEPLHLTDSGILVRPVDAWKRWEAVEVQRQRARIHDAKRMQSRSLHHGTGCSALQRAAAYLSKVPPAVAGDGGNHQTFLASCVGRDFGLSLSEFLPLLAAWNERCVPPWSSREIERYANGGYQYGTKPFGWRLAQ